jgi:hypothetical protein
VSQDETCLCYRTIYQRQFNLPIAMVRVNQTLCQAKILWQRSGIVQRTPRRETGMTARHWLLALILTQILPVSASAQPVSQSYPSAGLSYADIGDLGLSAGIVGDVIITKITKLDKITSAAAPLGFGRILAEARITALIRGPAGQSPLVRFLADVPLDQKGRLPRLKKQRFILFADRVDANNMQVQLLNRHALRPWDPLLDQRVRSLLQEAAAVGAAPRITGIQQLFSVPGSIPGENETQIFLNSANGQPISVSVLRRPGQGPRWIVSLDEIVDEAAAYPARDTLTWYRLACFLPRNLPPALLDGANPEQDRIAAEDYGFVMQQLGPCPRTLGVR